MAQTHSIVHPWNAAYYADAASDAIGNYFSGLVDGEGHFGLHYRANQKRGQWPNRSARFKITLRADDKPILESLRSFFGGIGFLGLTKRKKDPPLNPAVVYTVTKPSHLWTVIVPHFRRYPLRAKKARDFAIWQQAIELMYNALQRPRKCKGRRKGFRQRWFKEEDDLFASLALLIQQQRKFDEKLRQIPEIAEREVPPLLRGLTARPRPES